jgi:hypothetical protein
LNGFGKICIGKEFFCVTRNRSFGTAPEITMLEDKVTVLSGCHSPVILRPGGESFETIGAASIEGLMKGEVAARLDQGEFPCSVLVYVSKDLD